MTHLAVLGLDAGGSKTKGLRAEGGRTVRSATVGSANVLSVGVEEAMRQIDALLDQLGREGLAAVCVGAAGADTPGAEEQLRRLLRGKLPHVKLRVVHDTRLILAASGLDHGIALISGTGSVAWGRAPGGTEARAGGWGYLLGDEGGGYGVARAAVRHALADLDQGRPADGLTRRLLDACGLARVDQLLDAFYADSDRRHWANRAGAVFELAEEGDPSSTGLVGQAADALAELAAAVARRLGLPGPVVLAGGLVTHQARLQQEVRTRLARWDITDVRRLDAEPVAGAVRLAEELL